MLGDNNLIRPGAACMGQSTCRGDSGVSASHFADTGGETHVWKGNWDTRCAVRGAMHHLGTQQLVVWVEVGTHRHICAI